MSVDDRLTPAQIEVLRHAVSDDGFGVSRDEARRMLDEIDVLTVERDGAQECAKKLMKQLIAHLELPGLGLAAMREAVGDPKATVLDIVRILEDVIRRRHGVSTAIVRKETNQKKEGET